MARSGESFGNPNPSITIKTQGPHSEIHTGLISILLRAVAAGGRGIEVPLVRVGDVDRDAHHTPVRMCRFEALVQRLHVVMARANQDVPDDGRGRDDRYVVGLLLEPCVSWSCADGATVPA